MNTNANACMCTLPVPYHWCLHLFYSSNKVHKKAGQQAQERYFKVGQQQPIADSGFANQLLSVPCKSLDHIYLKNSIQMMSLF